MHITLHLTQECNLNCDYCYRVQRTGSMALETAVRAVEVLAKGKSHCGVIFFGGEPLLRRELMFQVHDWCEISEVSCFHYKVTTNGVLLDEAFIHEANRRGIHIALSIDGNRAAHDRFRVNPDGSGSFDDLLPKMELLLRHQPYAPVMMTVTPETIPLFADSVMWLQSKGVSYLICSMHFAGEWTDRHIKQLKKQYLRLADWHFDNYRDERKFYFSPFDKRIAGRVFSDRTNSCLLGIRQISVGPDGTFFPCVQFVGHNDYAIGSIEDGLDLKRQREIFEENEQDRPSCSGCALERRCHNKCGCLNFQTSRSIRGLPEVLCEYERMLYPIADALGTRLFKLRDPMFIQRHYNTAFPILSFLEDLVT